MVPPKSTYTPISAHDAPVPPTRHDVVIENPIINSPFDEPQRHFLFTDSGITNQIVPGRRVSTYYVPVPKPRSRKAQPKDMFGWTEDRAVENKFIEQVRARVALWRQGGYVGVTSTSLRLLNHWRNPERERRLFFCQIEAVETAIYLAEVANSHGDQWIENVLQGANQDANPLLYRIAFKMATGSGKTAVMAMLISWQCLNKIANRQSKIFSDTFLIVSPGITIRARLRVLTPNDPENYYARLDIVPSYMRSQLEQAKIAITNFHSFQLKEKFKAAKITKDVARDPGQPSPFVEDAGEMVRRVCRDLGKNPKGIIVLNDEAHHCYRRRPEPAVPDEKLTGEDRKEAEDRNRDARIWISGLEAIKKKLGIRVVYDLSATPFFLRGSGYREGDVFPWVVSDFSLIDAIECGIVKVPRVPVADNAMTCESPTYRELYDRVRDDLKQISRRPAGSEPALDMFPKELEGALLSLYANYEKSFQRWEQNTEARKRGVTPPVFIVVCNNTKISDLIYKWIAGYESRTDIPVCPESDDAETGPKSREKKTAKTDKNVPSTVKAGNLPLFRNEEDGRWLRRPNTVLIDSTQLESGEAFTAEFKAAAAVEIEEFRDELRERYPGRDVSAISDEELLREVMNTVGKPGKLGEHIRCVVSVSMLTEGWDANTVTHILGVRAFGTQLLCEQVVGRGLRRMSYEPVKRTIEIPTDSAAPGTADTPVRDTSGTTTIEIECFRPEYAEIYGVPFSFIPCAGTNSTDPPGQLLTRVRSLPERAHLNISFPNVLGYRYEIKEARLQAEFTEASILHLSPRDVPTVTEVEGLFGAGTEHRLELEHIRPQQIAFALVRKLLLRYFNADSEVMDDTEENASKLKHWRFQDLLRITREWMDNYVRLKDEAFIQMLALADYQQRAVEIIYEGIARHSAKANGSDAPAITVRPIMAEVPIGDTSNVDFQTGKPVYETDPEKCPINFVVADTQSWEQKMAWNLEHMPEVISYVKNQNLGFTIPYTFEGREHEYVPDFIAVMRQPDGNTVNLIIEVSGERRPEKQAKVNAALGLWLPAINETERFGNWGFVEVRDPWNSRESILKRESKIENSL